MSKKVAPKTVNFILLNLVVLDLVLAVVAWGFPWLWTTVMHGAVYPDPLGMIRRLGSVWAMFFVLQTIAWRRWRAEPYWLVLIAGVRWTELFSDWVYWYSAEHLTWFGYLGLLISPPANAFFGWTLLKAYRQKN